MGIVYVLTNEAMPGLIKIGLTQGELEQRILSLDNTSVALPFECYYAGSVDDAAQVEKALHTAFGDHRVRANREFFELDPYRAKAVLDLLAVEDVTPQGDVVESPDDLEAVERVVKRRPPFRFSYAGIPVGATIEFARDSDATAIVVDDTRIRFRDEETSLSAAAIQIMSELGYASKAWSGPALWLFEGKTLSEHRAEAGNW
jgi:hypothetical protein